MSPPSPEPSPRSATPMQGALLLLTPLLLLLSASIYTVDAREVAVITSFGAPVRSVLEPGIYMRAPWPIQEIRRYDRRARLLAVAPTELLTRDKKNLVVESVVLWRVSDPQLFLESVGGPEQAELQLGDLATSRIAAALGQREFGEMLNTEQGGGELLPAALVAELASTAQSRLGVEVIAVQLKHFGFPLQTEASIYERMRAERSRIANAYRSEGEEKAATIRAEAERQAAEIGAEAERQAASIQAEAEEAAARLYAEAWATNPALYRSLRELEAAEAALGQDDLLVISTDDPLLRGLRGP